MSFKVLVSAGEASGDLYASRLVSILRQRHPEAEFFGCAGPRMQQNGVDPVVDSSSLAVVGLVEVIAHIPRIYGEFRKLKRAVAQRRPQVAILTDSPDFHLRLAKHLNRSHVPVVYLVAPQVWAWRKGRLPMMRRLIDRLLCIFPFEEAFFRGHGMNASYIGHPLARLVRPSMEKSAFFAEHEIPSDRPLIALLPGSRTGELKRHLPDLIAGVEKIGESRQATFVLGLPLGFAARAHAAESFWERIQAASIKVIEGKTWDLLAHADLALAASGTVAVEAALLGTPMVLFYRVNPWTWTFGRRLVDIPFFSMVNLVAERRVVPELIQHDMSGERLASEALRLLDDAPARAAMRRDLEEVRRKLSGDEDPLEKAADIVDRLLEEELAHVS